MAAVTAVQLAVLSAGQWVALRDCELVALWVADLVEHLAVRWAVESVEWSDELLAADLVGPWAE